MISVSVALSGGEFDGSSSPTWQDSSSMMGGILMLRLDEAAPPNISEDDDGHSTSGCGCSGMIRPWLADSDAFFDLNDSKLLNVLDCLGLVELKSWVDVIPEIRSTRCKISDDLCPCFRRWSIMGRKMSRSI